MSRLHAWMWGTAITGCLLTAAGALAPSIEVAYRAPELHVAIETAATLSATLAALLLFGRYREDWRLGDLLLAAALTLLAASNLFFLMLPSLRGGHGGSFSTWASVGAVIVGGCTFAAAAHAPQRRLPHPRRAATLALVACACATALIAALAAVLGPVLPRPLDPAVSPANGVLGGTPALLALQGVAMAIFATAAVGFARRAASSEDELTGWVAVGAVMAAVARLDYLVFPSLYTDWVYLGDLFRLAFYLALLVGAFREIWGYQHELARAASLEERRRMARELHDGLAQELAFISAHSQRLKRSFDPRLVDRLTAAAGRALDESRGAISSLTRELDEPFGAAIADAAEEVAHRHGVEVELAIEPSVEVPAKARDAMRRIVREAVANAVRHGAATTVAIRVTNRDATCRLRISDDGSGFDQDDAQAVAPHGFGLVSMQERAADIGAQLEVRSRPGNGTEIEVVLP